MDIGKLITDTFDRSKHRLDDKCVVVTYIICMTSSSVFSMLSMLIIKCSRIYDGK